MRTCGRCGTTLTPNNPGGLCPTCFLLEGLCSPDEGLSVPSGAIQSPPSTSQSPDPDAQVRLFGDYELLEEIAHGGMGVIYKARQVGLDRIVAIKMMLMGPWAGADFVSRFRAEALAAASLQHPNIVALHEVGEHEGQPFFSMDYVEGKNLADLTRGNPLPASRAATYLETIAKAVHYAHERGILHRDLKPSNILIDAHGQPRITDFGLAKRFDLARPAAHAEGELTVTGQTLGSPNYVSPEQAQGRSREAMPATDVYGLGAVLYHLLTGRPPFQAESITDVLQQVSHTDSVLPRLLNPSVPRDLETICLKCLEKDIPRRYRSASALAEDLRRFLDGQPVRARPVGTAGKVWRWCHRQPLRAGLLPSLITVFALGLTGVLWQWRRAEHERRIQRLHAYASDMKAIQAALQQNNGGMAVDLLRRYLPTRGEEDLRGLEWRYLWQQSQGEEVRSFAHPTMVHSASLSPDGRHLATLAQDGRLRVWDAQSGRQSHEFPSAWYNTPYQSVAFSPDGQWLAAPGNDSVELRDTLDWKVCKTLKLATGPLCFSADGRLLATLGTKANWIWDLSGPRQILETFPDVRYCGLTFTPDSRQLICAAAVPAFNREIAVELWDLDTRNLSFFEGEKAAVAVASSPDGQWLAAGTWQGDICLWDFATRQLRRRLPAHRGVVLGLSFSPDGQRLASGGNDQAIHLWEFPSLNKLHTFYGHSGEIHGLSFSHDGKMLVSASTDGTARLWNTQTNTSLSRHWNLPTNAAPIGPLSDGSALVTVDGPARQTQLRRLADGVLLGAWPWDDFARRGCVHAQFLIENELVSGLSTNGILHFWDLRTGTHQRSISVGRADFLPWRLSADQRWLVGGFGQDLLLLVDLQNPTHLIELPDSFNGAATFSADGRWLAYSGRLAPIALHFGIWRPDGPRRPCPAIAGMYAPCDSRPIPGSWPAVPWMVRSGSGKSPAVGRPSRRFVGIHHASRTCFLPSMVRPSSPAARIALSAGGMWPRVEKCSAWPKPPSPRTRARS